MSDEEPGRRLGRPPLDEVPEGERRAHILAAAVRLFEQRGYAAVSLGEIAVAVGVTKAALYHHFASKQHLYAEVVCSVLEGIAAGVRAVASLPLPLRDRITMLTRIAVIDVHPEADMDSLLRDVAEHLNGPARARVDVAHRALFDAYADLMRTGMQSGELSAGDPRFLAQAYHYLLSGFAGRHGAEAGFQGRSETVDAVVDLFLHGVAGTPEPSDVPGQGTDGAATEPETGTFRL